MDCKSSSDKDDYIADIQSPKRQIPLDLHEKQVVMEFCGVFLATTMSIVSIGGSGKYRCGKTTFVFLCGNLCR